MNIDTNQFVARGGSLVPKVQARGVRHKPGVMNGTEEKYAKDLEMRRAIGDVLWFAFEAVTLKLGQDLRYTPDFAVMRGDGSIEMHECKGFWRDDALVKIKAAAQMFPFKFISVAIIPKRDGGGWKVREF